MEIYTTKQAGEILGLAENTVRTYILRYNIGTRHGRDWILTKKDLDTIRSRMGNRGKHRNT